MDIVRQMIVIPDMEDAIHRKLIYSSSELLANDWDEAYAMWLPLAEAGDAKAQFNLGYCYERGKGTDFDIVRAIAWYEKSAAQGSPRACRNLGLIYRHKDVVFNKAFCEFVPREFIAIPPNIEKSDQYFEQAISLGDDISIFAHDTHLSFSAIEEFNRGNKTIARAYFQELFDQGEECGRLGLTACDIEIETASFKQTYAPSAADLERKYLLEFWVRNNSTWSANIGYYIFVHDADKAHLYVAPCPQKIPAKGRQKLYIRHSNEFDIVTFSDLYVRYEKSYFRDFSAKLNFKLHNTPTTPTTFKIGKSSAMGCFVVTVCTGSDDNNTVEAFRQFRDMTLARYAAGRAFISWYYRNGPQIALWISDKPKLKKLCGAFFHFVAKLLRQATNPTFYSSR